MGPVMAADVTAFVDRIVAAAKIVGLEIDQVGILLGCCATDQGRAVGIVTEKTGHTMADNMTAMTRKRGLKSIEQNGWIMTAKTKRIVALGITQRISIIFITGQ